MTPRQLKYFVEIARQLNMTKASVVLHVTQPALSRQMKELEASLGVKLFTRSDLGVSLTAAGRLLQDRAPALLDSYREVSLDVAALADVPAGSLRFGVPPSLCDLVTVPSAREYKAQHPTVRLSITEAQSSVLVDQISDGTLDFAIVALSDSESSFSCTPLIREQMYLGSRPGALAAPGTVAASFLATLPLVASRQPNALRRILDDCLAANGGKARLALEANSVRVLTRLSGDGVGHCVLPYSALAESLREGKLEARPVENVHVTWALLHVRNVEPTPSVLALVNLIIDISRRAIADGRWHGVALLTEAMPAARP